MKQPPRNLERIATWHNDGTSGGRWEWHAGHSGHGEHSPPRWLATLSHLLLLLALLAAVWMLVV